MSIEVMRYVWKHSKSKSNARLMLLAIADIANDNGDAYPGVDKLGVKCNVSHRCAQDVIQDLERLNELQVYENVGTKTISGWTNLYRVILEGVDQGIIRNPKGEPAKPRAVIVKKSRLFPKGVQIVAPLKDVQIVAPDDMQLDSPHEVQTVAPKALEYPPEDTSDNTKQNSATNADRLIFQAVGLGVFSVREFKGLSPSSLKRIGALEKIARQIVKSKCPDVTDQYIAEQVMNFTNSQTFKPSIQGNSGFELKFAAYLESQTPTPSSAAPPPESTERETPLTSEQAAEREAQAAAIWAGLAAKLISKPVRAA